MQGLRKGEWSAITQVKVFSPEICLIALGQGFLHLEASIAAHVNGECDSDVPGSKSIAGHSTVHSGTWDSHTVPKEASLISGQGVQAKELGVSLATGEAEPRSGGDRWSDS